MRSINLAATLLCSLSPLLLSCAGDSDVPAAPGPGGSSSTGGNPASGATGSGGVLGTAGGTAATSVGGASGNTTGGTAMGTAGMAIGGGGGASTGGASGGAAGGFAGVAGSSGGTAGSSGGTAGNGTGGAAPAAGYPLKNPPVASAGCSKPLSTFKIGTNTYKITSAGLNREYIVNIPENYDPNAPHRLVFGMHWYKGSADDVQGWSKWFGLKALDKDATIFVAPNGTGNPPLWTQGEKDHAFFDDLVKLFGSELCVDKSRLFSVGFSFGAMFSNSLAQTHQDVLRGVVVYAAADVNIYFPANTGKPLAYMGVHGLKDPTCSIASGRSSRDRFVKNNGCTVPATVPEAKSGNHVTYDYKCPSNYPVQWTTFDGGHTYPPNDTGTWVYGLTWDFITQF
jgi:poly(3-hydroxybutyrate) depolymerase